MRLKLGEMQAATVFNDDPAAQARAFRGARASSTCTSSISTAPSRASRSTAPRSRRSSRRSRSRSQLGGGIRDFETIEMWLSEGHRPRHPRHGRGAQPRRRRARVPRLSRPHRRRHRRQGRQGRGRRLGGDVRAHGDRAGAPLRGRRRRGHHLYRHRARRHPEGPQPGGDGRRSRARPRSPSIASGGLASIEDIKALLQPEYAMLEGAITGRALYDGRSIAREALALIAAA